MIRRRFKHGWLQTWIGMGTLSGSSSVLRHTSEGMHISFISVSSPSTRNYASKRPDYDIPRLDLAGT